MADLTLNLFPSHGISRLRHYAGLYRTELFENILPFWLGHSLDREFGGYLTCLDRRGEIYDTDKFAWLQGREAWCFAMFCHRVEQRPEWLEAARLGAVFLRDRGRDPEGRHYFALTREGRPLVQPCNIFSDCFAAMAYGALARLLPGEGWEELAQGTFAEVLERKERPKAAWDKSVPGTRPLRGFALPMILCNLALELEPVLGKARVDAMARELSDDILATFPDPETGLLRENVGPGGAFVDCFEGRLLNPGHGLEACWFLMDLGERLEDRGLVRQASDLALRTLDAGWDGEQGGIHYFLDLRGRPPLQLEWDQKLWWVHVEALVALAKSVRLTGSPEAAKWFERVHGYAWPRFRDPEHPEWFGYLDRAGRVLIPAKGGKWKGCFHIPRGLFQVWRSLEGLRSLPQEEP